MRVFWMYCFIRKKGQYCGTAASAKTVQVLLIWQVCIVDGSETNMQNWHLRLQKGRLAAPITDAQVRLAMSFLRELEPDFNELNAFQYRYNALFHEENGVHWLH